MCYVCAYVPTLTHTHLQAITITTTPKNLCEQNLCCLCTKPQRKSLVANEKRYGREQQYHRKVKEQFTSFGPTETNGVRSSVETAVSLVVSERDDA